MKVLCITKRRGAYGGVHPSSGLYNSVRFIVAMLNEIGVDAKMVDVVDNNSIDREVHKYRPDICIIDAIWIIPEKFAILKRLHPKVKWVIRNHSDIPFLSNEGNAIRWLFEYLDYDIKLASNRKQTADELSKTLNTDIAFLPNYYPLTDEILRTGRDSETINIGCFGAIRPLKNQLVQAMAAIEFADRRNQALKFYINTERVEGCGESILKNLRSLFDYSGHELVELPWLDHKDFIKLLGSKIDLSMQVSFNETFNIVSSDACNLNIPIVVSPEVYWASKAAMVKDTTNVDKIVERMEIVIDNNAIVKYNKNLLGRENERTKQAWCSFLGLDKLEMSWTECIFGWCFKRFRREDAL